MSGVHDPKLLIVEDDAILAGELLETFSDHGIGARAADRWPVALEMLEGWQPDLIILDQRLGSVDTLLMLPTLRAMTSAPVLFLTGNRSEADRVIGLELGADDFLLKPIAGRELVARVRAHLRRTVRRDPVPSGEWRVLMSERRVYRPDRSIAAQNVVADNIANAQTIGFKRSLVSFEPRCSAAEPSAGSGDGFARLQTGRGARLTSPVLDMAPGRLRKTGRPFDLAIEGEGFFELKPANDEQAPSVFVRSGRFSTGKDGVLVLETNMRRYVLHPPIAVPSNSIEIRIRGDGNIELDDAATRGRPVGRIHVVAFNHSADLTPAAPGVFTAATPKTDAAGRATGVVRSGFLEESNVELRDELDELERLQQRLDGVDQALAILRWRPEQRVFATQPHPGLE